MHSHVHSFIPGFILYARLLICKLTSLLHLYIHFFKSHVYSFTFIYRLMNHSKKVTVSSHFHPFTLLYSLTHSFICLTVLRFVQKPVHLYVHSLTSSFVCSRITLFSHVSIPSLADILTYPLTHSYIHLLLQTFAHSVIRSYITLVPDHIHSFIPIFTHLLTS